METSEWSDQYQAHLDNPPTQGTILKAFGDEPARLDIEIKSGKPPFVYSRVFVPCVVGEPIGWYLQPMTTTETYGWKCILLPKAREDCLKRFGVKQSIVAIKSLKVVRVSKSGSSLLCEVNEYYEEPTDEEPVSEETINGPVAFEPEEPVSEVMEAFAKAVASVDAEDVPF